MTPCRHRVNYYETDKMGITHHANYLHWMEEARVDFLDQLGWSYARLEELGVFSPVTSLECAYRAPTTFGDLVDVTVAVREYRGARLVVGYEMRRADGTLVLIRSKRSESGALLHCTGRDIQTRELALEFNQDGHVWELRSDSAVDDPIPSEEVLEHLLVWLREAGSFSGTAEELSAELLQRCGVLYPGNVLKRKMRRSWSVTGSSAGSAGHMTAA